MAVITQDQYNVVKQRYRKILIKINLLNFDFQVVGSIEGNLTTGGVTINANSDIRRTCNITIVIQNHTFKIDPGGEIWLDKYIQVYYGIINNSTDEIVWTNMGIYMINNPNHIYDSVNNTITFAGLDLMAKLTGIRNGYFEWLNGIIEQGEDVRTLFVTLLNQAGFSRYNIEDMNITLPYEIEVSVNNTLYDIFNEIRNNVLPNYEMFFDTDGVFNLKRIYNGALDPIIINNDIFDKTVMNITNDIDFESVKNVIEIWGQTLDPTYGNPVCTLSDNIYSCTILAIEEIGEIPDYTYIGFGISSAVSNPRLKINDFDDYPILENGNPVVFEEPEQGQVDYYIVVFDSTTNSFELIGYQQIHCIIKDTNVDSPFYIGSRIGEILLPLSGGEYDNIQTRQQVRDRAEWELYNYSRMNDKIRLTSVVIPWVDVNQKIEYINEDAELSGIFIIKNVSLDLAVEGTMTLECIRWYDYDPWDNQ